MTIEKDVVLWDNGSVRFCLLQVPFEQQYKCNEGLPCITFKISYESENYKGCDTFTLFDTFYSDIVSEIEKTYSALNGDFRINDVGADTDGYIDFKMKNGRLSIKGQLGASFSLHSLRFEFDADQTLVGKLLHYLSV